MFIWTLLKKKTSILYGFSKAKYNVYSMQFVQ